MLKQKMANLSGNFPKDPPCQLNKYYPPTHFTPSSSPHSQSSSPKYTISLPPRTSEIPREEKRLLWMLVK
jgi:hypothetical protein